MTSFFKPIRERSISPRLVVLTNQQMCYVWASVGAPKSKMSSINVLTLNCWGIPISLACKYRKERIDAIGNELGKGDYDIVLLQEVWLKSDYQILCSKMNASMPYSHYFYSGMVGSGVCVFSKGPIRETLLHRFHLNGYAHKIHHGDWFGGKGIGLCKITYQGLNINVYSTHIHAEYDRDRDEYLAHRISQAFEISQFIKHTSESAELVILGGDLNLEPVDLGYKLVRSNAKLHDAWIERKLLSEEGENGSTNEVPSNCFACPALAQKYPEGKRIDYIMYRGGQGHQVSCEECHVCMGKILDKPYNFSDHEAVHAMLSVTKSTTEPDVEKKESCGVLDLLLNDALTIVDKGLKKTHALRGFFTATFLICLFVLYLISGIDLPFGLNLFMVTFRLILVLTCAYAVWTRTVLSRAEENGLMETKADLMNLIQTSESLKRQI